MSTPRDPRSDDTGPDAPKSDNAAPSEPTGADEKRTPRESDATTNTPGQTDAGADGTPPVTPSAPTDTTTPTPPSGQPTPPREREPRPTGQPVGEWWQQAEISEGIPPYPNASQPQRPGPFGDPRWDTTQNDPGNQTPGTPPPQQSYPHYPHSGYPPAGAAQGQGFPPTGGQPPYEPFGPTPTPKQSGKVYSILGFVCAVIAILFCPILFGPAGIILGVVGHNNGEPLGKWAAIAAGVGMVLGFVLEFLVFRGDLN
ncbi:hypothetical protein [Nocardia callitridis]